MKGNFKGSGKGKGKDLGGKKGTSGKSNIVCWTRGQSGHTSRDCHQQYRVSAVDETSVEDWLGDQRGLVRLMTSVGLLPGMMILGGLQVGVRIPGPTSRPQLRSNRPLNKQLQVTLQTRHRYPQKQRKLQ